MNDTEINWQNFLKRLAGHNEVTVVGPLAQKREQWPDPTIFVDGGSRHQSNNQTQFSVGDGDSSFHQVDHLLPSEKDFSDLAYVFKFLPDNLKRVAMVGFLGGRRDHEMINLGETHHFLKSRPQPTEVDIDWTICAFSAGLWHLQFTGLFSLIAFEEALVRLTGSCRYKLEKPTLLPTVSSLGLSNESNGLVEIETNRPVFIFKNPFT